MLLFMYCHFRRFYKQFRSLGAISICNEESESLCQMFTGLYATLEKIWPELSENETYEKTLVSLNEKLNRMQQGQDDQQPSPWRADDGNLLILQKVLLVLNCSISVVLCMIKKSMRFLSVGQILLSMWGMFLGASNTETNLFFTWARSEVYFLDTIKAKSMKTRRSCILHHLVLTHHNNWLRAVSHKYVVFRYCVFKPKL